MAMAMRRLFKYSSFPVVWPNPNSSTIETRRGSSAFAEGVSLQAERLAATHRRILRCHKRINFKCNDAIRLALRILASGQNGHNQPQP